VKNNRGFKKGRRMKDGMFTLKHLMEKTLQMQQLDCCKNSVVSVIHVTSIYSCQQGKCLSLGKRDAEQAEYVIYRQYH